MKLSFNGKVQEVKVKVASPKVKNYFIDKLKAISQSSQTEKILEVVGTGDDAEIKLQEAIKEGKLNVLDFMETEDKILQKDKIYRELACFLVDINQLTTKEKEIFNDDVESDFWLEQDITEIEAAVDSFRYTFKLQNF